MQEAYYINQQPGKSEPTGRHMPEQREFRQHLRNLAVSAMRVLIEEMHTQAG